MCGTLRSGDQWAGLIVPSWPPYYKMTRSHKVSSNILNSTDSHLIPVTHSRPLSPLSPLSLLPTQKYLFKVNSWRHTGTVQTCCMLSLDKDHLRFLRMRHFDVIMNWLDKFLNSPDQTELLSLVTTQPGYHIKGLSILSMLAVEY